MAASPHAEGHDYGFPPGFDTKQWVVQFNRSPKPSLTLIAPFSGRRSSHHLDIPPLRGNKTCIGQDGDWWSMCDECTGKCFRISLDVSTDQTPQDGVVMATMHRNKSLSYRRPGDKWSKLQFDSFTGVFVCGRNRSRGNIYATTTMGSMVVIETSPMAPCVERTNIKHYQAPCLADDANNYLEYLVESCGDIFLIRSYLFGRPREVVNLDAHRWNPSRNEWDVVETIGDRTFFLGKSSFAVSSARRAGTEPNCIHILRSGYNSGFVIYSVSLEDMTIRLNVLEGSDRRLEAFWFVPSRLKQEPSTEFIEQKETNQNIEQEQHMNGAPSKLLGPSNEWSQWSDLHTDLVELFVPKMSFIDFLHLRAVCKQWSSISSNLIQHAKVLPLLMTTCPTRKDSLDVFDLLSQKKYTISLNIPDENATGSQILRYSKNGWVILSRGCHSLYMVNPFKRPLSDVIILPALDRQAIKGVSFSSVPGLPDFLVAVVQVNANGTLITMKTWQLGDKHWTEKVFNNGVRFLMASHNPIFFEGDCYCLDINGRIGVFKPDTMEWSVLDKPAAVRSGDGVLSIERCYSYLIEWKGELIAIFRANCCSEEGAIEMYKLDRSKMEWSELDGLQDAVVFWDRKNALARPPTQEDFCNKMFLPNYAETEGGREHAFYCLGSREYPSFCGQKEPINALWFEPNLEYFQ